MDTIVNIFFFFDFFRFTYIIVFVFIQGNQAKSQIIKTLFQVCSTLRKRQKQLTKKKQEKNQEIQFRCEKKCYNTEPKCKKVIELPHTESENAEPEITAFVLEEYSQDNSKDATLTSGMSKPVHKNQEEKFYTMRLIQLDLRDMLWQQLKNTEAKLDAAKLPACLMNGDETKAKFNTAL